MKTLRTIVSGVATVCGALLLATSPSQAAKPGGGGSSADPCKDPALVFPAYAAGALITQGGTYSVSIRLADATGKCVRTIASNVPGLERSVLLMSLGGPSWRVVWTDGDGSNNSASDGIVVQDVTVAPEAMVTTGGSQRIPTGPVTRVEALPGGNFLFISRSAPQPASLYKASVTSGPAISASPVATFGGACSNHSLAVGPDGDNLYLVGYGDVGGVRADSIYRYSLSTLQGNASNTLTCDNSSASVLGPLVGGHIAFVAVGRCAGGAECVAVERTNVRNDPCVPDYYRTDVFANWSMTSSTVLQMAKPSWGSAGILFGRATGSASKNSCTAKVYDQLVKRTITASGTAVSSTAATNLSTGRSIDAPNPFLP